jgi:hypothetical protein
MVPSLPPSVGARTARAVQQALTVKLTGRAIRPDQRRGRTLFCRARGDTTELHGPLQRLLGIGIVRYRYL